jgi:hypothetical protein
MRKGSINAQKNNSTRKDGAPVAYGPYSTLTYKDSGGKTHTESIAAGKLDFYRGEIEKFRKFQALSAEYVQLAEQKSKLAFQEGQEGAGEEKAKKNRKS